MASVTATINVNVNAKSAMGQLAALQKQMVGLNKGFLTSAYRNVDPYKKALGGIADYLAGKGYATSQTGQMMTTLGRLHKEFDRGTASIGEYRKNARHIDAMAADRVRIMQSQYHALGREVRGMQQVMSITPTAPIKQLGADMMMAQQRAVLMRRNMEMLSTGMINWGKNTQWAGRQMMVGMGIPMGIAAAGAIKSFNEIEQASISFRRVYGDSATSVAEKSQMLEKVHQNVAREFTKYGIAVGDTLDVAAKAAATGAQGDDLVAATTETMRLATLGQMDYQTALESTIAMQTAFGIKAEDMGRKTDFLNAVENQTILSMEDMSTAVPRVATVIKGLGGGVEELAVMMTALRVGGVTAEQGANALKSGLASLINPTSNATKTLDGFGININKLVKGNEGDLIGLVQDMGSALDELGSTDRQRALEAMFGKYQYARMGALFKNIDNKQVKETIRLANEADSVLAKMSEQELAQISDSPMIKLRKAIEDLKDAAAPLGGVLSEIFASILSKIEPIVRFFGENKIATWALVAGAALTGLVGVVTMVTGVFANFIGTMMKLGQRTRDIGRWMRGKQSLRYTATDELEAATAAKQLDAASRAAAMGLKAQAAAARELSAALSRLTALQRSLAGGMGPKGPGGRPGGPGGVPILGPGGQPIAPAGTGRPRPTVPVRVGASGVTGPNMLPVQMPVKGGTGKTSAAAMLPVLGANGRPVAAVPAQSVPTIPQQAPSATRTVAPLPPYQSPGGEYALTRGKELTQFGHFYGRGNANVTDIAGGYQRAKAAWDAQNASLVKRGLASKGAFPYANEADFAKNAYSAGGVLQSARLNNALEKNVSPQVIGGMAAEDLRTFKGTQVVGSLMTQMSDTDLEKILQRQVGSTGNQVWQAMAKEYERSLGKQISAAQQSGKGLTAAQLGAAQAAASRDAWWAAGAPLAGQMGGDVEKAFLSGDRAAFDKAVNDRFNRINQYGVGKDRLSTRTPGYKAAKDGILKGRKVLTAIGGDLGLTGSKWTGKAGMLLSQPQYQQVAQPPTAGTRTTLPIVPLGGQQPPQAITQAKQYTPPKPKLVTRTGRYDTLPAAQRYQMPYLPAMPRAPEEPKPSRAERRGQTDPRTAQSQRDAAAANRKALAEKMRMRTQPVVQTAPVEREPTKLTGRQRFGRFGASALLAGQLYAPAAKDRLQRGYGAVRGGVGAVGGFLGGAGRGAGQVVGGLGGSMAGIRDRYRGSAFMQSFGGVGGIGTAAGGLALMGGMAGSMMGMNQTASNALMMGGSAAMMLPMITPMLGAMMNPVGIAAAGLAAAMGGAAFLYMRAKKEQEKANQATKDVIDAYTSNADVTEEYAKEQGIETRTMKRQRRQLARATGEEITTEKQQKLEGFQATTLGQSITGEVQKAIETVGTSGAVPALASQAANLVYEGVMGGKQAIQQMQAIGVELGLSDEELKNIRVVARELIYDGPPVDIPAKIADLQWQGLPDIAARATKDGGDYATAIGEGAADILKQQGASGSWASARNQIMTNMGLSAEEAKRAEESMNNAILSQFQATGIGQEAKRSGLMSLTRSLATEGVGAEGTANRFLDRRGSGLTWLDINSAGSAEEYDALKARRVRVGGAITRGGMEYQNLANAGVMSNDQADRFNALTQEQQAGALASMGLSKSPGANKRIMELATGTSDKALGFQSALGQIDLGSAQGIEQLKSVLAGLKDKKIKVDVQTTGAEKVEELKSKMDTLEKDKKIKIDLEVPDDADKAGKLEKRLDKLSEFDTVDVQTEVEKLPQDTIDSMEDLKTVIQELNSEGDVDANVNVEAETEAADEKLDTTKKKAKQVDKEKPNVPIKANASDFNQKYDTVSGKIATLKEESVTIPVTISVTKTGDVALGGPIGEKAMQSGKWQGLMSRIAFASGGHAGSGKVRGPGGPTEDKIPAMLSNGEYVIRASSVAKYGTGVLGKINRGEAEMGAVMKFAAGGSIGGWQYGKAERHKGAKKNATQEAQDFIREQSNMLRVVGDLWQKMAKKAGWSIEEIMALIDTNNPELMKRAAKGDKEVKKAIANQVRVNKRMEKFNDILGKIQAAAQAVKDALEDVSTQLRDFKTARQTENRLFKPLKKPTKEEYNKGGPKFTKGERAQLKAARKEYREDVRERRTFFSKKPKTINKALKLNSPEDRKLFRNTFDEMSPEEMTVMNDMTPKQRRKYMRGRMRLKKRTGREEINTSLETAEIEKNAPGVIGARTGATSQQIEAASGILGMSAGEMSVALQNGTLTLAKFNEAVNLAAEQTRTTFLALQSWEQVDIAAGIEDAYISRVAQSEQAQANLDFNKNMGMSVGQAEAFNQQGQTQITAYEHQIELQNREYEKQSKLLDKIAQSRQQAAQIEQGRTSVAAALSKGDVSSALAAAQQLQETQSQLSFDQMRQRLAEAHEAKIEKINEEILVIKDEIYKREQELAELQAQAAVDAATITKDAELRRDALLASVDAQQALNERQAAYIAQTGSNAPAVGVDADQTPPTTGTAVAQPPPPPPPPPPAPPTPPQGDNKGGKKPKPKEDSLFERYEKAWVRLKQGKKASWSKSDVSINLLGGKGGMIGKKKWDELPKGGYRKDLVEALESGNKITDAEFNKLGKRMGLASGGWIPGAGNKDNFPAMLMPGEFVMNKKSAARFGPLLEAMNYGRLDKSGGATTNISGDKTIQIIINGAGQNPEALADVVIRKLRTVDDYSVRGINA